MKLEFNKKASDKVKAAGACGANKKDNCAYLKLPGKQEAHATSPLSDKFTVSWRQWWPTHKIIEFDYEFGWND